MPDERKPNEYEQWVNEHFEDNEKTSKQGFVSKLDDLAKFYRDINDEISISGSRKEMIEKIEKMRNRNRVNKADFISCGKLKLHSLASHIKETQNMLPEDNVLRRAEAFPTYEIQIDDRYIDSPRYEECSPGIDRYRMTIAGTSPKARYFNNVIRRTTLFKTLESQNKFIENITYSDHLADTKTNGTNVKDLEMNTESFPIKDIIAGEFNDANYMFPINKKTQDPKKEIRDEWVRRKTIVKDNDFQNVIRKSLFENTSRITSLNELSTENLGYIRENRKSVLKQLIGKVAKDNGKNSRNSLLSSDSRIMNISIESFTKLYSKNMTPTGTPKTELMTSSISKKDKIPKIDKLFYRPKFTQKPMYKIKTYKNMAQTSPHGNFTNPLPDRRSKAFEKSV